MATNTYTALATQVLGTAASSVTFTSIPQGYTDLELVVNSTNSSGSAGISIRVGNGSIDSGSNYSLTYLAGDGSTAFSGRQSNVTSGYAGRDTTTNGIGIAHFMNYSNTTTYKTIIARGNDSSYVFQYLNLWRSTAAINTITLYNDNSVNFAAGSSFTLYAIQAA